MQTNNPFGNPYAPVGQGITALAQAFLAKPSALDSAKGEALAWEGRNSRLKSMQTEREEAGLSELAEIVSGHQAATYDPRQVMAAGLRSGRNASDLSQLFLTMAGNLDMGDENNTRARRAGAMVGTGRTLNPTDAVTLEQQKEIQDQQAAQARAKGPDMTRDRYLVEREMAGDTPEQIAALRERLYGPEKGFKPVDPVTAALNRDKLQAAAAAELGALWSEEGDFALPPELTAAIYEQAVSQAVDNQKPIGTTVAELFRAAAPEKVGNWNPFKSNRVEYDRDALNATIRGLTPTPAAAVQGVPAGVTPAPAEAIAELRANNTPEMREYFLQEFKYLPEGL